MGVLDNQNAPGTIPWVFLHQVVALLVTDEDDELVLAVELVDNVLVRAVREHDDIVTPQHIILLFLIEGHQDIVDRSGKPEFRVDFVDIRDLMFANDVLRREELHKFGIVFIEVVVEDIKRQLIAHVVLQVRQSLTVLLHLGLDKNYYLVETPELFLQVLVITLKLVLSPVGEFLHFIIFRVQVAFQHIYDLGKLSIQGEDDGKILIHFFGLWLIRHRQDGRSLLIGHTRKMVGIYRRRIVKTCTERSFHLRSVWANRTDAWMFRRYFRFLIASKGYG